MFPITRAALAAAATLLLAPAVADAQMQVGFQGDGTIVDNYGIGRDNALNAVRDAGGQWVRIIVQEQDWHRRSGQYTEAVATAKGRGLNVMVTLARYRGWDGTDRPGATVPEWQAFTASAVSQLGAYVDAWGTTNEPNHAAFAPYAEDRCKVDRTQTSHAVIVRNGKRWIVNYKRVKAGRGKYVRRVSFKRLRTRAGTHKRTSRGYVRVKKGRYLKVVTFARKRHGNYTRQIRATKDRTVYLSTDYEVRACVRLAWAVAYRPVHDAAAREIRAGDPTAAVIVGDLAPGGTAVDFYEAVFEAKPGPVDADAVGIHPYTHEGEGEWLLADPRGQTDPRGFHLTSIESTVAKVRAWQAQGRLTGGQTWITEFGFRPEAPAFYWSAALSRAQDAGVPVMVLYELTQHHEADWPWDTGLLNRDGSPRPAWNAVAGWLASR